MISRRRVLGWLGAVGGLVVVPAAGFAGYLYADSGRSNVGTLTFRNRLRIPPILPPSVAADGVRRFQLTLAPGRIEALQAGASGFLAKTASREELCRAVHVVAEGEALLSPSVTRTVIAELARRPRPPQRSPERLAPLTAREREVLASVATGSSNAEIAEALRMSPLTVKTHVSRIITKLGVRDRTQLVVLAYESGLITPGG
ncbi:DNA-binding response regulator [Micromonospora sp. DT231]|uniref:DNA-binding response regulator n=1 Tax=Micromonospora sp. DT231 TaxID=3416526 RepID=UPI003CE8FA05